MTEPYLTNEEKNAIAAFKRLAKRWPKSLHAIVIDGNSINICKHGVPSEQLHEEVKFAVTQCCYISDVHE